MRFLLQGFVKVAGRLPEMFSVILGVVVSLLFLRFGPSTPAYLVFPLAGLIGLLVYRMAMSHSYRLGVYVIDFLIERIERDELLKFFVLLVCFVFAMTALATFLSLLGIPIWLIVLVALGEAALFTVLVVRGTRIRY